MDPEVKVELKKLSSAQLCSSALGQVCMDAIVNPPKPGEPSYDLFIKVIYQFLYDSGVLSQIFMRSFFYKI